MGPRKRRSTVLTPAEEAMIVAFRQRTLLPLDDVMGCLRDRIPNLTRSSLHRWVLTDNGVAFADLPKNRTRRDNLYVGLHIFGRTCKGHGITHKLTKPYHPWTNGQVERMNRSLKEATVRRYHYANHDELRAHIQLFLDAYNHARRLKALRGLTPYEAVCQAWTKEPDRFRINPSHHTPGLNT